MPFRSETSCNCCCTKGSFVRAEFWLCSQSTTITSISIEQRARDFAWNDVEHSRDGKDIHQ